MFNTLSAMLFFMGVAWCSAEPAVPKKTDSIFATFELVQSLEADQQSEAVFTFDDPQRQHWMFLPGTRAGLPLRDMTTAQREKLQALLRTVLSARGMDDLEGIYAMEVALQDAAKRRGREDPTRDPDQYEFAMFGEAGDDPWAWHFEGHHLSLNFTHIDNDVSVTPLFIGVAPFELPDGPHRGMRVLGDESDAGFRLLGSLDEEQRARAIISDRVPGDVHTVPGREDRLATTEGIPLRDLDESQQAMAMDILREYVGILQGDLAAGELKRIEDAGIERIHFAWAGASTPGEGHYFRLHGPTFILEYDCIGGNPDHVHMVWHDPERNFGADPLEKHRQQHHAPVPATD